MRKVVHLGAASLLALGVGLSAAFAEGAPQTGLNPPGTTETTTAQAGKASATTEPGSTQPGSTQPGTMQAGTLTPNAPPAATTTAGASGTAGPEKGANSFTEDQAQTRIANAGYSQVNGLKKDDNGVWRGTAMRNGRQVNVWLDYAGHVGQS
jgi:hypothetical protein